MKYLTDDGGNITDIVLNIKIFDSLPEQIKDFILFGKPYEENENDLILSETEEDHLNMTIKESKKSKTRII